MHSRESTQSWYWSMSSQSVLGIFVAIVALPAEFYEGDESQMIRQSLLFRGMQAIWIFLSAISLGSLEA